ncbi:ribosome silencing factor [Corynebacterium sp.]|uniref:ribosome silencing factor n=1 Tax=Corynebacterium sp. TaxID=1720 RepID=UPI0027B8A6C6|nr:ribosome silencing factor [Corynebacterium sp.]
MTVTDTARELTGVAVRAADEKSAANIVAMDVSDVLGITEVFIIASADTERAVKAIVDEIEEELKDAGRKPLRREGQHDYRWVLMDYGDIVVHVQHNDERDFYGLDRLYGDCPLVEVEGVEYHRPGNYADSDGEQVRSARRIDDIPVVGEEHP